LATRSRLLAGGHPSVNRVSSPQIRRHDECKQSEGAEGRPEHTPEWPKTERWGVEGEEQRQEIAPQSRSGRNGAHDAGRK